MPAKKKWFVSVREFSRRFEKFRKERKTDKQEGPTSIAFRERRAQNGKDKEKAKVTKCLQEGTHVLRSFPPSFLYSCIIGLAK